MNCGSMIIDIFVIIVNEYLYNRVPKGGNMKQCRKNCAPFREYWPRGYPGEVQGLKWTHCPYCDSGRLVDKEAELKEEFIQNVIEMLPRDAQLFLSSKLFDEFIFSRYNITRKEDKP